LPFSPEYVRAVLTENFEDAKALLLTPLFAVHYAHLVMLAETGIVSPADARAIRDALDGIDLDALRSAPFDSRCEDLFFHVDRLVAEACGLEAAGRLHTARSRNDIDMTMYRMRLRLDVVALLDALGDLRRVLIDTASRHRETVFPATTHTQPAQPTTLAHYLLAVIEERERDQMRLMASFARINRCPLGACAITGTGFPIDRQRTADLLGFDGPTGNTYGSIAAVDHLLEACGSAAVAVAGLGRFVQDLLLWCATEVGYLRLADDLVQISSIMPQKRNPVALEHARAILSKALGQFQAVWTAVHNTPFGDIVDTEDDLQPLVASAFRDAGRGTGLIGLALGSAQFDVDGMRSRAEAGWISLTEVADALARDHGVPFSVAHRIASRLARESRPAPSRPHVDVIRGAARELTGRDVAITEADLSRLLSPVEFVRVRRTLGGPSPDVTAPALDAARARLDEDQQSTAGVRRALEDADRRRRAAVDAL
jgi:argininosuccinate lyase